VITHLQKLCAALVIVAASVGIVSAQDKSASVPAKAAPAAAAPTVPLRVQIVISRYDGDKKVSSLPYVLSVNAGQVASLRMGTKVGVDSGGAAPTYQDVGTNIDCRTAASEDGRFKVDLTVDDSSVEEPHNGGTPGALPAFRSFRAQNSLVLKDGQSAQFTTAVDKVSGVVTKVDVLLTVVK
jgi:hypothetical protein